MPHISFANFNMIGRPSNPDGISLANIGRRPALSKLIACPFSIPKTLTESDINSLCQILPKLIQWRLLVFYAPFYTGPDFTSPILEPRFESSRHNMAPMGRRIQQMLQQTVSEYAAHRARVRAEELLGEIRQGCGTIDLYALHKAYSAEGESSQTRTGCDCGEPPVDSVSRALVSVSTSLEIPMCQIEMALKLYARYVECRRWDLVLDTIPPEPVYCRTEARRVAKQGRWQELAQAVYEDTRTVSSLAKLMHSRSSRYDDDLNLSDCWRAVVSCRDLYFVSLRRGCKLKKVDDCTLPNAGEPPRQIEEGSSGKTGISCVFSPLNVLTRTRSVPKSEDTYVDGECECETAERVAYRLNRREEARRDGSYQILSEMLSKKAGTSPSYWTIVSQKRNRLCNEDTIVLVPMKTIPEGGEESSRNWTNSFDQGWIYRHVKEQICRI